MAKTRRRKQSAPRRNWGLILLVMAVVIGAAIFIYREPIAGNSAAVTAYSARVACSCRFVAGRSLEDCEKDKMAGMELVMLSENEEAKSVTATLPLVNRDTATFREGYGCVLEDWKS